MENKKNYHGHIDSYLRNELTEEDRVLFEQALKKDSKLREEYLINLELLSQADDSLWISEAFDPDKEQLKKVEKYFRSEESRKFKTIIEQSKNDYKNSKLKNRNKIGWLLPILAAASVLLIISIQLDFFSKSSLDLYTYYSKWEDLPSLTSRDAGNELSRGQFLFEQEKYDKSFEIFSKYDKDQKEISSSILIYLGLSALELEKYSKALESFDRLIDSETIDQSMGYWYKALTYLKMGDRKNAKVILNVIISDPINFNYDLAKELLSDLE